MKGVATLRERQHPARDATSLYTIGLAGTSAEEFFELLRKAGVRRILDVRLNNTSQLAGFAKRDDLAFFAREIGRLDYVELKELAPTADILAAYRQSGNWAVYARAFVQLLTRRRVERTISAALLNDGCLLCSEKMPDHCHRRLVAEYFQQRWPRVAVNHLVTVRKTRNVLPDS
jgi:uncharacterized protein (DUF488 family)